jgi:hypothetical protein
VVAQRRNVDAAALWTRDAPVHLPGLLSEMVREHAAAIRRSRALFARLAAGADPTREIWRRLGASRRFRPAGSSVDTGDAREIEKVHVDRMRGGRIVAPDLFAKFSWIRPELQDRSLRIRFSFGDELSSAWLQDPKRRRAANEYCEAVFPESAAIAGDRRLRRVLYQCRGQPLSMCERIVFANAPGGGARFHHDAEPTQRGVLYVQLAGATAWLALPKRELATAWRSSQARTALRALDRDDAATDRWLNSDPHLTRRLAEDGHLHVLRAGDVLLLPSHGHDDCAWHSVFALGTRPSLAHSYGLFDRA